jgi:DNA-binding CsgD family transcriptional regulator
MGNGCDAYTSSDFAHGVTPELLASRRDFWESLSELLSPRQYACLTRTIDGESQQCIADSLGITQRAVGKAFASAIAKIRSSGSLIDDLQAIVTRGSLGLWLWVMVFCQDRSIRAAAGVGVREHGTIPDDLCPENRYSGGSADSQCRRRLSSPTHFSILQWARDLP